MLARHAVLLTPSVSLRLIQPLSCAQITHACPEQRRETPRIPFFIFKSLRTLSFSVSRKSCVCRSYENGRVCTNNSHSGTAPINLPLNYFDGGASRFFRSAHSAFSATGVRPDPVAALNPFFLSTFNSQLSTLGLPIPYPLSFQTLAYSPALTKNSTLFFSSNSGLFRENTRGWDSPFLLSSRLASPEAPCALAKGSRKSATASSAPSGSPT